MRIYRLRPEDIDLAVKETHPASYSLGYKGKGIDFVTLYVGRVDGGPNGGLRECLMQHIGDHPKYNLFTFSYAASVQEAYEAECREFHLAGGEGELRNDRHPSAPEGSGLWCRVCGK